MFSQQQIDQFRAMFNQTSVGIKAYLEQKQDEIEQQSGVRPSMQELFDEIHGSIDEVLGFVTKKKNPLFASGLPGIRIDEIFGLFIPDLPLLSRIPNWHTGYFPEELIEKDRTALIKLYFDPRFQRLSHTFAGRLSIIAYSEGISEADLRQRVGLPDDLFSFSNFPYITNENTAQQEKVLEKTEELYDEKYGVRWIAFNEPPTGKALMRPNWLSGMASVELWWSNARQTIALEHRVPALNNYPFGPIEKKMNWMYNMPKFRKLSATIHGRMDIICRIELMSREQMAEELGLELEVLDRPEQHSEQIVQYLIGRFGDDYGAIWLAYGLYGLERGFAWQVLKDEHAFLRRVPALFRKSGRCYISYASANGEFSSTVSDGRTCRNCGGPLKGRIDKQYCSGACQRVHHYHMQNEQALNGIADDDGEQLEEEQPKEKSQFAELLKGPLGQIATGAIKTLVDRGVNKLGDQLFGMGTEQIKKE